MKTNLFYLRSISKKNICAIVFVTFMILLVLPYLGNSQTFTAGNIAVLQVASASGNNTTGSILEINSSTASQSAPVNTYSILGTGTTPLRFSGSAGTTCFLATSNDGSLLCFDGANTTNTSSNTNTILPRGIGTLNASYSFSLATTYTGVSGNQPRGATTLNNSNYYIADQGGFYTNNATAASPSGNIRCVKSFGGIVYGFTTGTTTPSVGILSAITGGTLTGLTGLPNGTSNNSDFYLISSGSNGASYDILYMIAASTASAGTIFKFSLVGSTWTANGSYTTTFGGLGICAVKNGTGAYLYVTTGNGATAANSVDRLIDAAGYNTTINITNTITLYTTTGTNVIKGIAFAPQPIAPVISTGTTSNVNISTATCAGNVTNDGGSTIIKRGICYGTSANPDTNSNKVIVSGTTGTMSASLTGLNPITVYHYRAFALNSAGLTYGADSTFTTLNSLVPTKLAITSINNGYTISANEAFNVVVQAQDVYGTPKNTSSVIKIVLTSTGTFGGTSYGYITAGTNTVTIQGVTLAMGTGFTITASDSASVLSSVTSSSFNVLKAASKLILNSFPSKGVINQVLTSFTVQALRSDNSLDSNFTGSITLNKISETGNILGTLTKPAVVGTATYNDIYFDQAGSYQVYASSTGLTSTSNSSIVIIPPPQMVELVVPKYIGCKDGASTNTERTPFAVCLQFNYLQPDTTYDLRVQLGLLTDTITASGAGNTWDGTTFSTNNISHAFTTDDNGNSQPVWILCTTTGNATRFDAGQVHSVRVGYAKTGGTIPSAPSFIGSKTITTLDIAPIARTTTTADDGAYLKGTVDTLASGKYVLVYDNVEGTGDPLSVYQIRQTIATQATQFDLPTLIDNVYTQSGNSNKGDYAVIIPIAANNPNGIRRIESRNADNTIFSFNTSANGIWINGANTTTVNRRDSIIINDVPAYKTLNVTAMLQEYFNGTGMNQTQGIDWNSGDLYNNFGNNVVDTLTIMIRETNSTDPNVPCTIDTVLYGQSINTSGVIPSITLPYNLTGYHYIVIIHRNSIQTWSDSVDFSTDTINYNFHTHISQFALDGGMYIDESNLAYIWGGDVNQNGNLESEDATAIYVAAISVDQLVNNGYVINDVDGNGNIDSQDYGLAYSNSLIGANVINPLSYLKKKK